MSVSMSLCVSSVNVPWRPSLLAQVPGCFSLSPGELLPGLARLRVPLEGEGELGLVAGRGGGAEAALGVLDGVEVQGGPPVDPEGPSGASPGRPGALCWGREARPPR